MRMRGRRVSSPAARTLIPCGTGRQASRHRRLDPRGDADPRLGLVLLSPGGAGASRSLAIPAGRWPGSSAGSSLGLLMAGLVSPRVGDSIQHHGGRPVLAVKCRPSRALGLIGLALAPALPIYLASWLVLGVGMGAGLYDAAFATLGRLYGQRARTADRDADLVRRVCQHRLLAALGSAGLGFRMARRLSHLRGHPSVESSCRSTSSFFRQNRSDVLRLMLAVMAR